MPWTDCSGVAFIWFDLCNRCHFLTKAFNHIIHQGGTWNVTGSDLKDGPGKMWVQLLSVTLGPLFGYRLIGVTFTMVFVDRPHRAQDLGTVDAATSRTDCQSHDFWKYLLIRWVGKVFCDIKSFHGLCQHVVIHTQTGLGVRYVQMRLDLTWL
jgi:hypothetical protein